MTTTSQSPALLLQGLKFSWEKKGGRPLLHIPSLNIARGEHVFIAGPSGSGKTTYLNLLCGINTPDDGEIYILGQALHGMQTWQRDRFRGDHFGVVFQQFNLLPYLSVLENVMMPCRFSRYRKRNSEARNSTIHEEAHRLLLALELPENLHKKSVQHLSVGQQQRVAAARAFIGEPEIIIADEPTSALDTDRQQAFLALLTEQCERTGATLIFVSHNLALAPLFDRVLPLHGMQPIGVAKNA